MSLLIDTPNFLTPLVEEGLKDAQIKVFVELFDRLDQRFKAIDLRSISKYNEEWHKNHPRHDYFSDPHGCGCELCVMFRDYTLARVMAHRTGRYLERYYSIYPMTSLAEDYAEERRLHVRIRDLKKRRRELMSELRLIKYSKRYIPVETR